MADDITAPQADEPVVDKEVEITPEQELVESMVDVKGELVDNPEIDFGPKEPVDEEPEDEPDNPDEDAPSGDTVEPTEPTPSSGPVDKPEDDTSGVYAAPTATNPGDFVPGDYSFEVTTTEGKTVKVDSPEAAQTLAAQLDEEPGLLNASQYMKLNTQTALMMQQQAADKRTYDQQKEAYDQQQAQVQVRNDTISKWDKEISYLTAKGELPAVPTELNTAEAGAKWASDYADREGVKERLELFRFMEQENEKRTAAGLDPMTSMLEAHTELKLQRMTSADTVAETKEKTTRRAKGSLVGGPSPYIPSNTKAGEIVGTPGNINDVMMEYMNQ